MPVCLSPAIVRHVSQGAPGNVLSTFMLYSRPSHSLLLPCHLLAYGGPLRQGVLLFSDRTHSFFSPRYSLSASPKASIPRCQLSTHFLRPASPKSTIIDRYNCISDYTHYVIFSDATVIFVISGLAKCVPFSVSLHEPPISGRRHSNYNGCTICEYSSSELDRGPQCLSTSDDGEFLHC